MSATLPENVEIKRLPGGHVAAIKTVTRSDHYFTAGNGYPIAESTLDVLARNDVDRILIDEKQGKTYEFTLDQYQNGNAWCLPTFRYVPVSEGRSPPLVA